jgi:2-dehydropantoate 2-reductase
MQEIKKVAFLGGGALGAAYISKFIDAEDFEAVVVADGERYGRLTGDGLIVNGKQYRFPVVRPGERSTAADLIIVALKHHHLEGAVNDLKNLVDGNTTIISVMNGLDSEETIAAAYGQEAILFAISIGIDALRDQNNVRFSNPGKIIFGEAVNDKTSRRVQRLQAAFDRAGIAHDTPADMMRMMWWKFMINVGINQAAAVMRAPFGVFQVSTDAQALMEALMREVIEVARASDINLSEQDIKEWYGFLNTLAADGKPSMLQDIEAGRQTEVDIFAGKVVALGEAFGIPTPINLAVLRIIRVLEQHAA